MLSLKSPDPAKRQLPSKVAEDLDQLTVSTVMTHDPIVCYTDDTVGRAAELMLEHKIGGVPVISRTRMVEGIITDSDIFRLIATQWRSDNQILSGASKATS